MRKIISILIFLCVFVAKAQSNYIIINNNKTSVEDFKKLYKNNIEAEGLKNALNSFIEYELMLQDAKSKKIDTTIYFKSLYNQNIGVYTKNFYDSLALVELKKFNISIDSINEEQKKYVVNNAIITESIKHLKTDSTALIEVNNFLGEDFFSKKNTKQFVKEKIVFSTPTGKFTQKDYYRLLVESKKQLSNMPKLSEFVKKNYDYIKNKFLLEDAQNNMEFYFSGYKQQADVLRNTIFINYFIENNVYNVADNDSIGKKMFLKNNANKYTWPVRYKLNIFRYQTKDDAEKIKQWLKVHKSTSFIKKQFEGRFVGNAPSVVINSGNFPLNNKQLGQVNPNLAIQESTFRNAPAIIEITEKLPPSLMSIEDAGEILRDDYRSFYFNKILSEIKSNATIFIPNELKYD